MRGKGNAVTLPEIEMNDITDYYTVYVQIMGVTEDVFWHNNIGFVKTVAGNKQAFDKWMSRQVELRGKGRRKH